MADDGDRSEPFWFLAVKGLAAILVPAAVTLVGYLYTSALKDREVQAHYVDLSLAILQQKPDSSTGHLRDWAIDVVDRYSGVHLSRDARADIRDSLTLPKVSPAISPPPGPKGIPGANPIQAYIKSQDSLSVVWWHVQSKNIKHPVDRTIGPGLDSIGLDRGGTIQFLIIRAGTTDTLYKDFERDCSHGGCFLDMSR